MKKKLPKSPEELDRRRLLLVDAIGRESDRGCVLVGVAVLDEALEMLLRAQMPDKKETVRDVVDPLFNHPGPLATFWSRIRTAYALGFLSPITYRDLETVREIRNRFAHQYGPATFQDPHVSSLISSFKAADVALEYTRSSPERTQKILEALAQTPPVPHAPVPPTMERMRWAFGVGWIVIALESAAQKYRILAEHGKNIRPFTV